MCTQVVTDTRKRAVVQVVHVTTITSERHQKGPRQEFFFAWTRDVFHLYMTRKKKKKKRILSTYYFTLRVCISHFAGQWAGQAYGYLNSFGRKYNKSLTNILYFIFYDRIEWYYDVTTNCNLQCLAVYCIIIMSIILQRTG